MMSEGPVWPCTFQCRPHVSHTRNLDGSVCDLYIQVSCTRFSYEFLVQETWIVCQGPYGADASLSAIAKQTSQFSWTENDIRHLSNSDQRVQLTTKTAPSLVLTTFTNFSSRSMALQNFLDNFSSYSNNVGPA